MVVISLIDLFHSICDVSQEVKLWSDLGVRRRRRRCNDQSVSVGVETKVSEKKRKGDETENTHVIREPTEHYPRTMRDIAGR